MQSDVDPCLFYKEKIIVLCYVDDCLMFAHDDAIIKELYHPLKEDFSYADEREADGSLGVEIRKNDDGSLTLTTSTNQENNRNN